MNDRIDRIDRARHLGAELAEVMDALAVATSGSDVIVFLDRLARLEGFPPSELAAVDGLSALVAEAVSARQEHAAELGRTAGWEFDLDRLLDKGRMLQGADNQETESSLEHDFWLRDLLLLATVVPWFSNARSQQAKWALEEAMAIIEADAEGFLASSVVANDRHELEEPASLGPEARELLEILTELPLTVAFERAPIQLSSEWVQDVLDRLDAELIEAAGYAIEDREAAKAIRLPGQQEHHRLAAAQNDTIVLLRVLAGRWFVTTGLGTRTLSFEANEGVEIDVKDIAVVLEGGLHAGVLKANERGHFLLPHSDEGLDIVLRVGPDSTALRIEGATT